MKKIAVITGIFTTICINACTNSSDDCESKIKDHFRQENKPVQSIYPISEKTYNVLVKNNSGNGPDIESINVKINDDCGIVSEEIYNPNKGI